MVGGRRGGVALTVVVALIASTLATTAWVPGTASAAPAPSHTYTTSLDFSAGSSINVVDAIPDQLQLDDTTRAFGFIWVALSARGTVAKVDTATGEVLGEYRTAPDGRSKDPSRTTVDQDGNVWVGNRAEGTGGRGSVVHLGLEENGQCEDRNGNGQIDTSRGLGDIRAWPRNGDGDWNGGVTQAEDECIIHYVRTAGTEIRHVSVTPDNDVWVGGPRTDRGKLELLDSEGTSLRVIDMALPAHTGETGRVTCCYGGLVDANGVLWSATAGGTLVRIDPTFPNGHPDLVKIVPVRFSYGLGRDLDGNIWASNWTADGVDKVAPDGTPLARYATASGSNDRGVVASADGDIWVANSGRDRVTRLGSDGVIKALIPVGDEPTGVSVASDGKVWVTNLSSHDLSRIDPATNTVDLTLDLRHPGLPNPGPYNYSDMTGSTLTGRPDRGTWSVVHDAGEAGADWPQLNWTADVPGDGSLRVFVASSEDGTTFGPAVEVDAGEVPAVSPGRYLRIEVRFNRAGSGATPVLHDLSIGATNEPPVADAGEDRDVLEGGVVTLDGTASNDPDGDGLTYRWELVGSSGPPVTLTSSTGPTVSFSAPDDGSYTFDLTVSDGEESSTDRVVVTVVNAAPEAQARLDAAAAGGVSLLSGSFTDVGYFDTHDAVVDWGDGTPAETVPVAAQGTGWGTIVASHVYADPGSYAVTLTVRDDDGGESTVTLAQTDVLAPTAIWAGSESASNGLWVSGASVLVEGATHSNGDLRVNGAAKTFTGPTTYVRNLTVNGNHTFDPAATTAPTHEAPVPFTIDDYRPGGRGALAVGDAFHDMTAACAAGGNRGWRPAGALAPGLYFVPCDVTLPGALSAGPITVASTGTITTNGGARDFFAPYVDGVLLVSGKVGGKGIDIAGGGSQFAGYLLAPTSGLEVNGSDHRFTCGLIADTVRIAGARAEVRASDCAPPSNTSPDPTLVPRLAVGLAQTPAEVLPGDRLDDAVTVTNDGAALLVPTVVGAENLGADPARLDGVTLVVEARSAIDGSWAPVSGPVELTARANPHPGTTYGPGPDPFAGAELASGSLATWSVELQVALAPDTAAALVDPARTAAVRVRVELGTDPADAAIRPLWRFGDDLAPALADAGADLTDVAVTLIAPDGAVRTFDEASNPELGILAPGAGASLAASTDVPVPGPVQTGESADAYLARLRSLDGTSLAAASHARSTGGVGLVLAPQQVATSTRRLPVVGQLLNGPHSAPAGTDVAYDLDLANTGSAPAGAITAEASVDGSSVVVEGLPADLPAGGLASGTIEHRIADDHPGGTLAVRSLLRWSDANGNEYGPIRAERDTSVAGTPVVTATLVDALSVDADGTGQPSPGDTIAYTARITNTSGNPVTTAGFSVAPDAHSTLVVGSVSTSTGTVTQGNAPGDTTVAVDLGTVPPLGTVEITFSAVIADPLPDALRQVSVQGTVTGDLLVDVRTDDPATFGPEDPTVTPVFRAEAALGSTLTARLAVDRDGNGVVSPGDTLAYDGSVDQLGNTALDGVSFTLAPDPNTALVNGSVTTSRGAVVAGNGGEGTVTVDVGTLPTFVGAEIGFEVLVASPFPGGVTAVSAQATVTSAQTGPVPSDDPTTDVPGDATTTPVSVGGGIGEPIQTGPAVGDCSLEDGASVTAPTTLTCTLAPRDGTTVEDWTVTLRPAEGGTVEETVPLGSGTGETISVEIDPTLLPNGLWTVVITTTDDDGGTTVDERAIVIEGNLKLGRYSVTYQDMAVPVGGIPIQVLRTYDTLDRNTVGDFGHGWNLELANFRVQTNGPLGARGWEQYGCGGGFIFVNLCYRTNRSHLVTVTWPDGRVETFDFTPQGLNTFFSIGAIPAYTGRGGATSRLEPAPGDTSAGWRGDGNIYHGGFAEGPIYDPTRFVLVGRDGTRYLLDEQDGLVEATDRNGNRVWIDDDGIHSSLGPEIRWTRDAQGRIERLVGPDDEVVEYSYDPSGDLVTVVDPKDRSTGYSYLEGHYLERLDDPGPGVLEQVVYLEGRTARVIDASGNETVVEIDLTGRSQTVVSPDGLQRTTTTFDERGNPIEADHIYDGASHRWTWGWSDDGRDLLVRSTDPLGGFHTAEYDERGFLRRHTTPANQATGASTLIDYNEFGQITAVEDPVGDRLSNEYDARGNLVRIVGASGGETVVTYDTAGRPVAVRDPLGRVRFNEFTPEGWLATERAPRGGATTYAYDGSGRPVSVTDPLGAVTTLTYDPQGLVSSVTDPTGFTTAFAYDEQDRLLSETGSDGHATTYAYDVLGNLEAVVDALGRRSSATRDQLGRLVTWTNAEGETTTYGYDGGGQLTTVTTPSGRTTTYDHDAAGRVVSIEAPGRGTSSWLYDADGRAVAATNGAGETHRYEFDAIGRLVETLDPSGRSASTRFIDHGRTVERVNGAGETSRSTFDLAGQIESVTVGITPSNPAGTGTEQFTHDLDGNLAAVTDATGRTTSTRFDHRGMPVEVVDPADGTTTFVYDDAGRLVAATSATGITSTYGYDPRGRLQAVTDALGRTQAWTYDAAGQVVAETDAQARTTSFAYDRAGRLTSTTDALGGSIAYSYVDGRVAAVTDPQGGVRSYEYGASGDLATIVDPLGRRTTYTWDVVGRMATMTDGRGLLTTYGWNFSGQLESEVRQEPDATTTDVTYRYDDAGRLAEVVDPTGVTSFTRGAAGLPTSVVSPAGTVGYEYDAAGRRTAMTLPSGEVSYRYDEAGRLDAIVGPDDAGAFEFSYLADGRLAGITRPNGVATIRGYDAVGRLDSLAHTGPEGLVARYSYELSPTGSREAMTIDSPSGSRTERYVLDDLDRIVAADYGEGRSDAFAYDAVGNRLESTRVGPEGATTVTYDYDAAQQLTAIHADGATVPVAHDGVGNVVQAGDATYTWTAANRMRTAERGGVSTTYGYDALGTRVEVDGTPQLWDRQGGLPTLVMAGDETHLHGPGGPLATYAGANADYLLPDAVGTVRATTDAAGDLRSSFDPDVWGAALAGTGSVFGFTGQQTDGNGLVHMRARQYDQELGRFLSADAVSPNAGGSQGLGAYSYAVNNPTTLVDPSGHLAIVETSGINAKTTARNSAAVGYLGRCMAGILEDVAWSMAFSAAFGTGGPTLVDVGLGCAVGFAPGPTRPRHPGPGAPPRGPGRPGTPPGPRPSGPPPAGPGGPPAPRPPDAPSPGRAPGSPSGPGGPGAPGPSRPPQTTPKPTPEEVPHPRPPRPTLPIPPELPQPGPGPTPEPPEDPDEGPTDPAPGPDDDDDGPDCRESEERVLPPLEGATSHWYGTFHGDPFLAKTKLTPPQATAVDAQPWLTRPFFGTILHDAVGGDPSVDAVVDYHKTRGWDFQDRVYPLCRYELTTDNPGTLAVHLRRGIPRHHIVTYPSLESSWRFQP